MSLCLVVRSGSLSRVLKVCAPAAVAVIAVSQGIVLWPVQFTCDWVSFAFELRSGLPPDVGMEEDLLGARLGLFLEVLPLFLSFWV